MFTVINAQRQNLPDIAKCHMLCFEKSLATKLGKLYVQKTLEWFLVNENRFLFFVTKDGRVAGYCGGFMPVKPGDGSSSGMLQYAFKEAIRGVAKHPLLLFHPEVLQNFPFLWMNIKRKITGKAKPVKPVHNTKPFNQYAGLVVIGVHPDFRGTGVAQQMMAMFETKTLELNQKEMVLSVKKDNARAIKTYSNFGWRIREEHEKTFVMNKFISI